MRHRAGARTLRAAGEGGEASAMHASSVPGRAVRTSEIGTRGAILLPFPVLCSLVELGPGG